jgi:RHS repeat-associated protein
MGHPRGAPWWLHLFLENSIIVCMNDESMRKGGPPARVAASYTFDSFGNITNSTGTLTNPLRYTGREFDSETALYYYRARYYDPSTGRFLSEDPIGFEGDTNFYRYVFNDPIVESDPFAG